MIIDIDQYETSLSSLFSHIARGLLWIDSQMLKIYFCNVVS